MSIQEIIEHPLFPKAKRVIEFLLDRYQAGEFGHVSTPVLKEVAQIRFEGKYAARRADTQWKKVHELARDLLALRGLDLVNEWGGGYAIAHAPQQTVREIVKSLLRGFGHIGSAEVRREQFDSFLATLPREGARIWGQIEGTLAGMKAFTETSRAQLQEAMKKLDGLDAIAEEVSNIPDRLYEEEERRQEEERRRAGWESPKTRADSIDELRTWLASVKPADGGKQ